MSAADSLKLVALDSDDLAILSAHVQDAVLKVADLTYLPKEKRFVIAMNRFAWEKNGRKGENERRRSALTFDRVLSAKASQIRRDLDDAVLELLAVSFTEGDAPGGAIDILFAGGGTVRLEVEVIEARLADLGPSWATQNRPEHDLTDAPDETGPVSPSSGA